MPNHGEMIIYGLKAKSQSLNLTKKLPFFDTVLTLELIAPLPQGIFSKIEKKISVITIISSGYLPMHSKQFS